MNYREYASYLAKFSRGKTKISIVVDASDGSVGPVLCVLKLFGTKISILNGRPDGNFPAHGPDPEKRSASGQASFAVIEQGADFGAVFDGDGDRVFFVDDLGRRIDPDAVALLISKNFKPPYVVTPTSGWTFRKAVASGEIKLSPVGHYFIKQKMRALKAKFAAETSGHYYFEFTFGARRAYYDSALRALVEFSSQVSALKQNGQKLSAWLNSLPCYFSSGELNFKAKDVSAVVSEIKKLYKGVGKMSGLDGLSMEGKDFWFNIRPSNTEPLLRLNLEAKTKIVYKQELSKLKKLLRA